MKHKLLAVLLSISLVCEMAVMPGTTAMTVYAAETESESFNEETDGNTDEEGDSDNNEDENIEGQESSDGNTDNGNVGDENSADGADDTDENPDSDDSEENDEDVSEDETEEKELTDENADSETDAEDEEEIEDFETVTEEDDKVALEDENIFKVLKSGGYKITIYAENGVFPDGTEVTVKKDDAGRTEQIGGIIQRNNPLGDVVEELVVMDISFIHKGREIQPEDGTVAVAISLDDRMEAAAKQSDADIKVYHIAENDDAEEKQTVDPDAIIPEFAEDDGMTVGFEASEFSEYAVAVILHLDDFDESMMACGYVEQEKKSDVDHTVAPEPVADCDDYLTAASDLPRQFGFNTAQSRNNLSGLDLPTIRDQNPYGTCWAHASLSQAEIYERRHGGNTVLNLSERALAYFTYKTVTDPIGGTAGDIYTYTGENLMNLGGNFNISSATLAAWKGATAESLVPYDNTETDEARNVSSGINSAYAYNDQMHLTDWYIVDIKNNQDEAKRIIKENGAISLNYCANHNTTNYNSTNNCQYNPNAETINHAVTVVGWDDDYPAGNFTVTPPGNGAWLIRNSWLPASYEGYSSYYNSKYAYFWMSYYDASIDNEAAVFRFESGDNYDNNYQYDGCVDSWYETCEAAANVFTAKMGSHGEDLKAVAFFTETPDASYKVEIYKGLTSSSDPTSGTLATTQTGNTRFAGYHTVKLDTTVSLKPGEKYSVVVSVKDKNGARGTINHEYGWGTSTRISYYNGNPVSGTINSTASAQAGQSFWLYANSYGWQDYTQRYNGNIRIKAFTDNRTFDYQEVEPQDIIFADTALAVSGKSIAINETFKPGYRIEPQNADNKAVTWGSSNPLIASVTSDGTVKGVSVGTATITVKSVSGNATASFNVTVTGLYFGNAESEMLLGDQHQFTVTGPAATGSVIWASTNPSVISVNSTGLVKALDAGKATIKATCGLNTISIEVTAKPLLPGNVTGFVDGDSYAVHILWDAVDKVDYYQFKNPDGTSSSKIYPGSELSYEHGNYYGSSAGTHMNYTLYVYRNGVSSSKTYSIDVSAPTGKIIYHVGSGQNNPANPTWYKSGALLKILDPVSPVGYAFDGWYTDSSLTTPFRNNNSYSGSGVLNLYAKYTAGSYIIRLNRNDNSRSYTDVKVTFGIGYALPTNYSRTNYEFLGWNTKADGSGTQYAPGETVTNLTSVVNSVVNLYAQWSYVAPPQVFRITYYLFGGKNNMANPMTYTEGTTTVLQDATQSGYIFEGWYEQYDYSGYRVDTIGPDRRGNITLYAKWRIADYTITLANMDGAGIVSPYADNKINFTKLSAFTLKKPTRVGYTFGGWYSDARLKKKITKIKKGTVGNRTIYAKWTANKYKIKYNGNKSNSGSVKAMSCKYDGRYTIRANKYKKKGYTFIGWNTRKDGTGTWYYGGDVVSNLTAKKNGTVTLYAQWVINVYTITYANMEFEDGTEVINPNVLSYTVKSPTIRFAVPYAEGRTFGGWYSDPGFRKKITYIKKGSIGDKTIYAKWY